MIQITDGTYHAMLRHADAELPLECCGLLYGSDRVIEGCIACTNERRSETAFSIPLTELFDAFRCIRDQERTLQGIYHSHPRGPSKPSQRDLDEFEYRGVSYWIVSFLEVVPVVRCFHWSPGGFVEVEYKVVRP